MKLLLGIAFLTLTLAAVTALELSGPNVCQYTTWQSTRQRVNVTYRCWKTERFSGQDCEDSGWSDTSGRHHRWKRQTGHTDWTSDTGAALTTYCYKNICTTCSRLVWVCINRRITKKYCCSGYEKDGYGGCKLLGACGNSGCEQTCNGDSTGHSCGCFPGYDKYGYDNRYCKDVDECKIDNGGCDQNCHNTDGSYYCSCYDGYRLTSPHNCTEVNQCLMANGGCEHTCVNRNTTYYCLCDKGFKLEEGFRCTDIDECGLHNGGCEGTCDNEYGTYKCLCPEGKALAKDGRKCVESAAGKPHYPTELPTEPPFFVPEGPERRVDEAGPPVPVALIVGGILGFLCLIGLLFLIVCLARLYRRRRPDSDYDDATSIRPPPAIMAAVAAGKKVPMDQHHYESPANNKMPPKEGYTNLSYDNGIYGSIWGDQVVPALPVKQGVYEKVTEKNPITPPAKKKCDNNVNELNDPTKGLTKPQNYDNVMNEMKNNVSGKQKNVDKY